MTVGLVSNSDISAPVHIMSGSLEGGEGLEESVMVEHPGDGCDQTHQQGGIDSRRHDEAYDDDDDHRSLQSHHSHQQKSVASHKSVKSAASHKSGKSSASQKSGRSGSSHKSRKSHGGPSKTGVDTNEEHSVRSANSHRSHHQNSVAGSHRSASAKKGSGGGGQDDDDDHRSAHSHHARSEATVASVAGSGGGGGQSVMSLANTSVASGGGGGGQRSNDHGEDDDHKSHYSHHSHESCRSQHAHQDNLSSVASVQLKYSDKHHELDEDEKSHHSHHQPSVASHKSAGTDDGTHHSHKFGKSAVKNPSSAASVHSKHSEKHQEHDDDEKSHHSHHQQSISSRRSAGTDHGSYHSNKSGKSEARNQPAAENQPSSATSVQSKHSNKHQNDDGEKSHHSQRQPSVSSHKSAGTAGGSHHSHKSGKTKSADDYPSSAALVHSEKRHDHTDDAKSQHSHHKSSVATHKTSGSAGGSHVNAQDHHEDVDHKSHHSRHSQRIETNQGVADSHPSCVASVHSKNSEKHHDHEGDAKSLHSHRQPSVASHETSGSSGGGHANANAKDHHEDTDHKSHYSHKSLKSEKSHPDNVENPSSTVSVHSKYCDTCDEDAKSQHSHHQPSAASHKSVGATGSSHLHQASVHSHSHHEEGNDHKSHQSHKSGKSDKSHPVADGHPPSAASGHSKHSDKHHSHDDDENSHHSLHQPSVGSHRSDGSAPRSILHHPAGASVTSHLTASVYHHDEDDHDESSSHQSCQPSVGSCKSLKSAQSHPAAPPADEGSQMREPSPCLIHEEEDHHSKHSLHPSVRSSHSKIHSQDPSYKVKEEESVALSLHDAAPKVNAVAAAAAAAKEDGQQLMIKIAGAVSGLSVPTSAQEIVDRSRELWEQYLDRVREYRPLLLQADEYLGHLAFLAPSYGESGSGWIEVLFGLLQLSRLSMDLASRKEDKNPFGASVAISPKGFPATASRIALTVLQCIWPVAQELVRSSRSSKITHRRQARVRRFLERVRFLLRGVLLYQYWKQMKEEGQTPGLLLEGGQYTGDCVDNDGPIKSVPDVEQERARLRRAQYKGRRTGRKVGAEVGQRRLKGDTSVHDDDEALTGETMAQPPVVSNNEALKSLFPEVLRPYVTSPIGIMVGELLYIARPLLQAEVQARTTNSLLLYKVWALCLSMDVASLVALKESLRDVDGREREATKTDSNVYLDAVKDMWGPHIDGNAVTQAEWKRRRMRLFLYLLRAPIWDRLTRGSAENVSAILDRIPLFGGLMQNYLWDWLYYWKLYRAEEG